MGNEGKAFVVNLVGHDVAYSYWIGGSDSFETEVPFDFARDKASLNWLLCGIQLKKVIF